MRGEDVVVILRPVGEVRPYPYASLRRISRAEAARTNALLRRLPTWSGARERAAVDALLGTSCTLVVGAASLVAPRTSGLSSPSVFVLLVGSEHGRRPIIVEIDALLAASVLDRVLGGDGNVPPFPLPLTEVERGILTYVAGRLLADAGAASIRVAAVLTERSVAFEALGEGPHLLLPFEVTIAPRAGMVHVWANEFELARVLPPPSRSPHAFRDAPIDLAIEIGWGRLPREEVGSLRVGDALVLDRISVKRDHDRWEGAAELRTSRRSPTLHCTLDRERLTLERVERYPGNELDRGFPARGRTMSDEKSESVLELLADTPIELTVELGRCTLSFEEVAALRPGAIVATGVRIGEVVTIRAADRAIATGELVDLEGEVAVRIDRLVNAEP